MKNFIVKKIIAIWLYILATLLAYKTIEALTDSVIGYWAGIPVILFSLACIWAGVLIQKD